MTGKLEIDYERLADVLLEFKERRGQQNAQNSNEKDSNSKTNPRKHGQHSAVVAAKTDSK